MTAVLNAQLGRRTFVGGMLGMAVATAGMLSGCGSEQQAPDGLVEFTSSDTCSRCGMPISDLRSAAEIVGTDEVWKFDDTGEMFMFYSEQHLDAGQVEAMFVADFETQAWLSAESAGYVVSPDIDTPMSTHVAAFADSDAVGQYTASGHGEARSFDQLLADPPD
ncbi:nitrous oxide reductase accessory protein NosL [Brooklawnia cerclae]|uniref:Nitrous oxide reductase accessory protein NosL n=1 Tax=Brooklawnia cerclae TaxID=349934 RepID=A0ABX0SF43_9ACTN|nr:nitrous oxide reductase accessory protein NosL [Brooklawnia cerclae]NIH55928.1 nitrous oxide reductase accessory protein NosL [Brooklawnia cerclae]